MFANHNLRFILITGFFILLLSIPTVYAQEDVSASINVSNRSATMSNGIVRITINSKGQVNLLEHNGSDLLNSSKGGRLYFSYNDQNSYSELSPNAIRIEKQNSDYAEVVYSRTTGDLLLEQGFILRKGVSGVYSYVVVKGTSTPIKLREMRVVYRVDPTVFDYGYVTEQMQGYLPSVAVMKAVEPNPIMDATYQLPDGSVYTKYNWANYIDQDSVHGIMSNTNGLWAIPVSNEYMNGGPMKQELTVHATGKTPLVLQMLQGEHFGALAQTYTSGDEKIYGPFFIYANSGSSHQELIDDAKAEASDQMTEWPFQWFENPLYELNRTTVTGTIKLPAYYARQGIKVVLAQTGSKIYEQGKEYMFWDETNGNGHFEIKNVRPGSYSLYAYATQGEITDELEKKNITVSGNSLNLGEVEWIPTKYEHKLWQIGENNRLSDGYRYSDTLRNYGLYELPPANINYTVGANQENKNWYYAQTKDGSWTINFENELTLSGNAHFTASIAGAANSPKVKVEVNGTTVETWSFSNDASIYRSAVLSGRHTVKSVSFPSSLLVNGNNKIRLIMSNSGNRGGVMYDCLKLEAGDLFTSSNNIFVSQVTTATLYPNPFKDNLNCFVNLESGGEVSLKLFNSQGLAIATWNKGYFESGNHTINISVPDLINGVYFYQLVAGEKLLSGVLLKND